MLSARSSTVRPIFRTCSRAQAGIARVPVLWRSDTWATESTCFAHPHSGDMGSLVLTLEYSGVCRSMAHRGQRRARAGLDLVVRAKCASRRHLTIKLAVPTFIDRILNGTLVAWKAARNA